MQCICVACANIKSEHLDSPFQPFNVMDTHTVSMKMLIDMSYMKENGYYLLKDNIFHKLQFCTEYGVNLSTPVKPLHCMFLGIFIWLVQGLNCLRRKKVMRVLPLLLMMTKESHIIFYRCI